MMKRLYKTGCLLGLFLTSSIVCAASWQVDNAQSQLSFVSVKKEHIAEVHHFDRISGQVDETGAFSLKIDLASVNTGIEIRDARMKASFFEIDAFPTAELSAQIDPSFIRDLVVGEAKPLTVDAELNLHGQKQSVKLPVMVSKISDRDLLVVSSEPVILNVADYDLIKGLEKLRELAGLPSISQAVPVSFYLSLSAM